MAKHILLLGCTAIVLNGAQSQIGNADIRIFTGTNIADVRSVFSQASEEQRTIDHVFVGAGIDLDKRLKIVKEVFTLSGTTTIHLKDATSGLRGFLLFVKAVLAGSETASL